jgi:membrane protein CcdC involved in cytochrome C biogenesis
MRSTIVAVLGLFMSVVVLAQQPVATGTPAPPVKAMAPKPPWEPEGTPIVPDAGGPPRVYFAHGYDKETPNLAGLDDRLSIHVQNFGTLLKQANGNCKAIVLFIEGMPLKGDKAESCDTVNGHIRYRLYRDKSDDDAWHLLLGSPHGYWREVDVSVGSDTQFAIPSSATFDFEVIPAVQFRIFIGLIALAYPLLITSRLVRTGNTIMMKRSNAFFLVVIALAAIRFFARGYFDRIMSIDQTAALFFVLAFGMILRWRLRMLSEYRALTARASLAA